MPWHQSDPVNERLKFVAAVQQGDESMTHCWAQFGISRKTGYRLMKRYVGEGPAALSEQSRAPKSHPNRTPPEMERSILLVRKAHPTWGSKKIIAVLRRENKELALPARSTVDQVLKRAGLVPKGRRKGKRRGYQAPPIVEADGTRCDPLTVNDVFSRTSLECRGLLSPKLEDVKKRLEGLFNKFGMPELLLSDNGPPFGSRGLGGLTRLGVWLVRLGIQPVFIQTGHPEQNGKHERFHETLKAETASRPKATMRAQQFAFDRFTTCRNEERPHEALDMRTPSELYEHSTREVPWRSPEFEYDDLFEVRKVRPEGTVKWEGEQVFVGTAMAGEWVGIEPVGEQDWHMHLGKVRLGVLHGEAGLVLPLAEDEEN
ncbi:MAG: putative transposase [Planctomycetota bacterium]|jgi:putative transposase